ncbi:tetratricopeptide repeat protein [Candidatus Parcubacteria bacterium]|nr:MAG: tetratricopeptide repeat protein [Candidatus Parcubacteria bacterium]
MGITRQWLLSAILVTFVTVPVFGDEVWVVVETDKTQYSTGESLVTTGYIIERKMPVIAMSVYDPDGVILSANSVELEADDSFTKTVSLDSPFYDKAGIYLIDFDYGKNSEQITFEIVSAQLSQEQEPPTPEIIPEVIFLATDKTVYQNNEFITISGMVSEKSDPTILVGIYDQNDMPTGFYTPEINSDFEFSISFLVKDGVNFKTGGIYSVKAHYGASKYVTNFEFVDVPPPMNPISQQSDVQGEQDNDVVTQIPTTGIVNKPQIPLEKTSSKPAKTKIVDLNPNPEISDTIDQPKQEEVDYNDLDNLTVEDVELGKILNEITLNCDSSQYRDSISYYDGMGPALMRLCNYDQAISYFDQSLIEDPNNVEIITNKGAALDKLGQSDVAIAHYDLALDIDPTYLPAMNNKANVLAEQGEFEEAIKVYNLVLEQDPSYAISQANLQKAKESLAAHMSSRQINLPDTESPTSVEKSVKTETTVLERAQTSMPPSNIIQQIGSIFASFFGFLN